MTKLSPLIDESSIMLEENIISGTIDAVENIVEEVSTISTISSKIDSSLNISCIMVDNVELIGNLNELKPEGKIEITKNGLYDISGYGEADVQVASSYKSQQKQVTPTKQLQNVIPDKNYDALSRVIVNPIPNEYIVPNGDYNILENGNYDIYQYSSVSVNVPSRDIHTEEITLLPEKQVKEILPGVGVDGFNKITMEAIPDEYIIPTGKISITQNGLFDVTNYEEADVSVDCSYTSQEKQITPTKYKQIILPDENYDALSKVTVNSIPDDYIKPTGTYTATSNGIFDIHEYENIDINVSGGATNVASGTFVLDENYTSSSQFITIDLNFTPTAVVVYRTNWVKGVQSINLTAKTPVFGISVTNTATSSKAPEKFVQSSYINIGTNQFNVTGNSTYYLVGGVEYKWIATA